MNRQPFYASNYSLLKSYNIDGVLGSGGFGIVFAIHDKLDGQQKAALKMIPVDGRIPREKLVYEVQTISKLNHPNVVKHITSWTENFDRQQLSVLLTKIGGGSKEIKERLSVPVGSQSLETVCIQMELCNGNLKQWLKKRTIQSYNEALSFSIFRQVVAGLDHIHRRNIIHRDFKPANIFFLESPGSSSLIVKIGDFGWCVAHEDGEYSHTANAGASLYRAPEQGIGRNYSKSVDIYALGLILYELFDFDSQRNCGESLNALKFTGNAVAVKNESIRLIILRLISYTSSDRPTCGEILRILPGLEKRDHNRVASSGADRKVPKGFKEELNDNNGCKHYRRKCKIQCPKKTCSRLVWCRLCHDEDVKGHQLDRFAVATVQCIECEQLQQISERCIMCDTSFGKYYCNICHLFESSDEAKDLLFHCRDCGICRKKEIKGTTYMHCKRCEMCIPETLSNGPSHNCKTGAGKALCNFCKKEMFSSTERCLLLNSCGHYVHHGCLAAFPAGITECPACGDW